MPGASCMCSQRGFRMKGLGEQDGGQGSQMPAVPSMGLRG